MDKSILIAIKMKRSNAYAGKQKPEEALNMQKTFLCDKTREQLRATNYQLSLERGLKAVSSPFWQETLRWCGKWVKAHP